MSSQIDPLLKRIVCYRCEYCPSKLPDSNPSHPSWIVFSCFFMLILPGISSVGVYQFIMLCERRLCPWPGCEHAGYGAV